MTTGFTFDTGALIALERGDRRMSTVMQLARTDGIRVVVPAVALATICRDPELAHCETETL